MNSSLPTRPGKSHGKLDAEAGAKSRNSTLNAESCWRAVSSHDRRFDGRFFAGISTTGVYCRPTCPVSFGNRTNLQWFRSAALAEAAGFRPCKRCRPEIPPSSPAWSGTRAAVSRALRLIVQGELDKGNLENLAARVGMGPRHLRRLFHQHVGASPLKIARSNRAQAARGLIVETRLPMSKIAAATGFASIRQFNHSVKSVFGLSPLLIRRLQGTAPPVCGQPGVVLRLPYQPPFDWGLLLKFLRTKALCGVETVDGELYRRAIDVDGASGSIEVSNQPAASCLTLRVILPKYDGLMYVVERVRRLFDLGADVRRIGNHLAQDAQLARWVAARPGLRVPGAWDGFELAVRAILGQNLTALDPPKVTERLVMTFGRRIELPVAGLSHLFPQPEVLACADLSELGIQPNQAKTIRALARAVLNQEVTFDGTSGLDDALSRLTLFAKVSEGAAAYIAMRGHGEPDALPYADLGLRRHASKLAGGTTSPEQILRAFEKSRPWRAYAAMHLWAAQ